MPPSKKRTTDGDTKDKAKRRKKQKEEESDGSEVDGAEVVAGADFDNEPEEGSSTDVSFVCKFL